MNAFRTTSFTRALQQYRAARSKVRGYTPSRTASERYLRHLLNSGVIKGRKIGNRWHINVDSLEIHCAAIVEKDKSMWENVSWDLRARLTISMLVREAMEGVDRPCSWPFDVAGPMSKEDKKQMWSALNRELNKLATHRREDETAPDWVRMMLKMKPKLKLITKEDT